MQIYRGLDLGSAKPDAATQQLIKHHLIDVRPPDEIYSAGAYISDATAIVADIIARNKLPVIVGGTMFYIKALLDGINKLPPANAALREKYLSKYADLPQESMAIALHKELQDIDKDAAAKIKPADTQRVIRALELIEQSGAANLSELFSGQDDKAGDEKMNGTMDGRINGTMNERMNETINGAMNERMNGSMDGTMNERIPGLKHLAEQNSWQIYKFALNYPERAMLRQKLAERFQQFIDAGLIGEVKQLRSSYPKLDMSYPSLRAIGYRQVWEYLVELEEKKIAEDSEEGIALREAMIAKAITATRQFAKRQLTWLRNWGEEGVNDLDATQDVKELAKQIITISDLQA